MCREAWSDTDKEMPIHLCLYHVKKAWIKNLLLKVKAAPARKAMLKKLDGEVLHAASVEAARAALNKFYKDHEASQPEFVQYFKSTWDCKLGACPRIPVDSASFASCFV